MKCPQCSLEIKAASPSVCPKCHYEFLFQPIKPNDMSDVRFHDLLDRVSYNRTRYFSLRQLYHQYLKSHQKKAVGKLQVVGCLSTVLVPVILIEALGWVAVAIGVALFVLFFLTPLRDWGKTEPLSLVEFDDQVVRHWEVEREPLEWLIRKPSMHQLPDGAPFDDVYDYGVEKLLIVQDDLMVDLLVRNGWHAENKTLVLSESGYPEYVTEHAKQLLDDQPDLEVMILHDSSDEGLAMKERLVEDGPLPLKEAQIKDLGFSRSNVMQMKGLEAWRAQKGPNVPLDAMLYGTVAFSVTAAMANNLAVGDVIQQQSQGEGFGSSMDFG